MRTFLTIFFLLNPLLAFSQVRVYKGFIDKYPIQLITDYYSDGFISATYSYDKFDTPISINGKLKNDTLTLIEKNDKGIVSAILEFPNPILTQNELNGEWIDQNTHSRLKIRLTKLLEFEAFDGNAFEEIELLQTKSTKNHYFKLLISKKAEEKMKVLGVRIYQKKSDKLLQEIELYGDFRGTNSVSVNDFNFDGVTDFSVFEQSYSGANTSTAYLLRNPKTEKYFISKIQGLSLEFDSDKKLIYEHSQCCAGSKLTKTTYKIVNDKMVLVKKKCTEYNEETGGFVEVRCE